MIKESEHVPTKENHGRIYLDKTSIKKPMDMDVKLKQRNWCIMADERTGLKYSSFHDKKSDMVMSVDRCTDGNKREDL